MSEQTKPIISHEGSSILYQYDIDVEKENLADTKRVHKMADWSLCSVGIAVNSSGTSGAVDIKQSLAASGASAADPDGGAVQLTLADGTTQQAFGLKISGQFLVLDFAALVVGATGKISITILGKASS